MLTLHSWYPTWQLQVRLKPYCCWSVIARLACSLWAGHGWHAVVLLQLHSGSKASPGEHCRPRPFRLLIWISLVNQLFRQLCRQGRSMVRMNENDESGR